ncbi:unnamed protein product [Durusdinium trenchii]|uniref:Uncharacterized protein n=1 Tax=Durusdinium trenchii TaxID=1381693 RepID=A0ABP0IDX5_9DINO
MACMGGTPDSLGERMENEPRADKKEILPFSARDLLEGHSSAWQVFLAYAASCFPNVGPRAREDFGLALAEGADAEAGEKARLSLAGGELQAVRKQGGEHGEKNRDSCNFCGISDEHDWGVCFGCSWCIQDVLGQCTGSNVVQSSKCKARRSNSRWVWGSWHCHPPSPLQIAAATTAALQKLQTQELFTALGASSLLLESSEAEATVTLRALQLQLLRKSSDSMLQALQEAASSADQASTMLFEISELKKALQKRRAEGQGRKAQKLLEETEAAVARLKECHRQKTCLLRARKARLCRAEDVTSLSAGVLVFRGRHRLGIQRCQGGPLTAASPCWLKFEAATPGALPGVSDDYEEHGQAWRRRFEEALCHLWIRKVDQQLAESRSALLPFSEVPSLLHRLQVGLLQAGDFLQAVAAQRPRILELPAPEDVTS